MVSPDEETEHGDSDRRKRDKLVTKDLFSREIRYELTDHTHPGQDHDVNRRVRIEPEHMLEQYRVTADGRIKNTDMSESLECQQQNSDRDDGRTQDHHESNGVVCPDK